MRKYIIRLICIVLLFVVASCAKAPEPRPPIKIAINQWPGYAHAFVAEEKGFFAKNNVRAELVFTKEQSGAMDMFKEGRIDGVFSVLPDVIMLEASGIPAKAVCVADYSTEGDVIMARPGISSLAELKDRTVSFEGVNTFSHIFVLSALEEAGLKESDIKFADIPAHGFLKAAEEGRIDAGHTWEPTKSQALEKGYKILAKAGDMPGIIVDVLVFKDKVIKERPDDVRAIVKSLFEALDFLKKNPEEAIKIMAEKEDMSVDEMKSGLGGIYQPGLKENLDLLTTTTTTILPLKTACKIVSDFYLKRGQVAREYGLSDIFDDRFLKELGESR